MDSSNQYINERPGSDESKKSFSFSWGICVGMLLATVVFLILYFALGMNKKTIENRVVMQPEEIGRENRQFLNKVQTLEKTIHEYFYLEDKSSEELKDGMFEGMLQALDDPYSEYYSPKELLTLQEELSGVFFGIGAHVSIDTETKLPKIASVIDGSPAQGAGIRENDLVFEVDGVTTQGLTLTEAVSLIRGAEGTDVVLTVVREGETNYLEFVINRQKVEESTVNYEMLENQIGYIQITEFNSVTVDQFADALAVIKGSGAEKLILDLRANPGGSLDAVVDMCKMILPKGLIVYTEDKAGAKVEYACEGDRELELPLAVLIDMNSASAAEIMAGAIQDYGLGTLIGTTTYGKGIVQQIMPMTDGSAIKLTVSSYFTPSGRNIHGTGIEPDILCEFDGEAYYGSEEHPDNQLEKAKEVLKNE